MGNYFCKSDQDEDDFKFHPHFIKRMDADFNDFILYGKRIDFSQNLLDSWKL